MITSPKATNIIAYGETIGFNKINVQTLKASNKQRIICFSPSASDSIGRRVPSDSRWAIIFVIFNDTAKVAGIDAGNARATRDVILYGEETGMLERVLLVKKYIAYAFRKDSPAYQQINALKFRRD